MENPWGFLINQPRLFGKSWSSQRICLKKKEREDGKKERKKWGGGTERGRGREGTSEDSILWPPQAPLQPHRELVTMWNKLNFHTLLMGV